MSRGSFASTRQTSTAAQRPPAHAFWHLTAKRSRAVSTPSTMPSKTDTQRLFRRYALVLAHIVIDGKSNEIPAVQKLLEELDVAGHIVTLDAMHCQKKHSKPPPKRRRI